MNNPDFIFAPGNTTDTSSIVAEELLLAKGDT